MRDARWLFALLTAAALGAVLVAGCPRSGTPGAVTPTASTSPETKSAPAVPESIGNAKNADGDYICPVMGNVVTDFSEENSVEHQGKEYFFCCKDCIAKFKADPDKYVAEIQAGDGEEAVAPGSEHEGHDH